MRYRPEHKAEVRQKIVKDASHRVRAEGLNGAAVAAVMRDTGLTHGGFYKHFDSKSDLLLESLREAFTEIGDTLARAAQQSKREAGWKALVKTYLSVEYCDHAERGLPVAGTCAGDGACRRSDERPDLCRACEIQGPDGSLYARPAQCGQGARFFRDLFNHDRSR